MRPAEPIRIGYVLKMYPRFSETFILGEILAHERAGVQVEVFSLRTPTEGLFHEDLARVRAPVHYLQDASLKACDFWELVHRAAPVLPGLWETLATSTACDALDVHQAVAVAERAARSGIEHLHAHFASVATTVARLAARMAGITYSFTAHAKDIFQEDVDPADIRVKLADAAAVVTVSAFNVAYLSDRFGEDARAVHRVYNGMDLSAFAFHSGPRSHTIISVGRLVEKKGFDDLLRAWAVLRDRGVKFRGLIVGAGPEERRLREMIQQLELTDHAELLGPRPRGEVIRLVADSALFACPCVVGEDGNRDGLPTVLVEAMALGTPCVGTPVTGIPEVVRDGETGLMVPERDPAALADAMQRLLDDRALAARLALRARDLIESDFDIHRNTGQIRSLFSDAVASRKGNSSEPRHQRPAASIAPAVESPARSSRAKGVPA